MNTRPHGRKNDGKEDWRLLILKAFKNKTMKKVRKMISFLTILCCLAGSMFPAYAAESSGASVSGVPRVTFTNEPNNSPDLFVSKIVENTVPGAQYAAPEHAAYRFVLKIGGEVASNVKYRLIDSEHGEVTRKTSGGREKPFTTDKTGVFELEDGQQAWFEYVGTGVKYEVVELDAYQCPVTDTDGNEIAVKDGYKLYDGEGNLLRGEIEYQLRSLSGDGYLQKDPTSDNYVTGGVSTGEKTILLNGSSETFTNRYTGSGTGEKTTLKISKAISFPPGYTVPETPDFRFKVELDGRPYGGKEYAVIDTASGNPVIDPETEAPLMGTTSEDGCFTLKGGQTASFGEVPTELDYKIYELLEDGMTAASDTEAGDGAEADEDAEAAAGFGRWWAVGGTEHKGSTQAPLTWVNFNNANVSFVVTKRMEDYSKPDVAFSFRLADEKNNALAGAAYYLYNTTGIPVYDEQGKQAAGITDSEGSFLLKPGQAAVFAGMEPGKSFKVTETRNPDYVQVLPLPDSDTIYSVPVGGQIPFVDFVNKPADNQGSLTVTKELTYQEGEGPLARDDFHFVIYKQLKTEDDVKKAMGVREILFFETGSVTSENIQAAAAKGSILLVGTEITDSEPSGIDDCIRKADGICYYQKDGSLYELYAPLENTVYSVPEGLSAPTYKTGSGSNAGEFSIKAGQTARFDLLATGYKYLVKEFGLTAEYTEIMEDSLYYKEIYDLSQTADKEYAQTADLTGSGLSFLFTNRYQAKKLNLKLTKADADGNPIVDAPAHFMLYLDKSQKNPVYDDAYLATDAAGMLTFPALKPGTYWLYELKAPSGYRLLERPIEIRIAWGTDGNPEILVDGRPLADDSDIVQDGHIEQGAVEDGVSTADDTICIKVINKEFYKLPNSGGMGIYWYSIGGMLLMIAAALILYRNKHTGEVLKD